MWSESPIRYPRKRTAVSGTEILGDPPIAAVVTHVDYTNTAGVWSVAIPDPPAGAFAGVLVLTGVYVWDPEFPAGWNELHHSRYGSGGEYDVAIGSWIGSSPASGQTVDLTPYAGISVKDGHGWMLWLTGGSGGSFALAAGPVGDQSEVGFIAPPSGSYCWWQVSAGSQALGLGVNPTPADVEWGFPDGVLACYPARGAYDTTEFAVEWVNGSPIASGVIDWESGGSLWGQPFCVGWRR